MPRLHQGLSQAYFCFSPYCLMWSFNGRSFFPALPSSIGQTQARNFITSSLNGGQCGCYWQKTLQLVGSDGQRYAALDSCSFACAKSHNRLLSHDGQHWLHYGQGCDSFRCGVIASDHEGTVRVARNSLTVFVSDSLHQDEIKSTCHSNTATIPWLKFSKILKLKFWLKSPLLEMWWLRIWLKLKLRLKYFGNSSIEPDCLIIGYPHLRVFVEKNCFNKSSANYAQGVKNIRTFNLYYAVKSCQNMSGISYYTFANKYKKNVA